MVEYTLREYQREDVQKGLEFGSLINANPPGLGKTLETLVTLSRLPKGRTLVISPKMATGVWKWEADHWMGWDSLRITGEFTKKKRNKIREDYDRTNTQLLIINIAMLEEIQAWHADWDNVVVDEVHLLGLLNPKSKATLTFEKLKYTHVFFLTGTPVRKGPQDLYVMLHALNPKRFRSYWSYVNRYCVVINNGFGKDILNTPKNPLAFEEMLQYYMIRHPKPADLPPKIRQPFLLQMSEEQARIHQELTEELIAESGDELIVVQNQLQLCLRLRQLLVCPRILGIPENGEALNTLVDYLIPEEFAQGRSVAVATCFRTAIPFIVEAIKKALPGTYIEIIHGQIKEVAAEVAQRFQEHTSTKKIIIYSVKSGASWTAHGASTGFMLGYDWSAINNLQAEDRLHRLGQKNTVFWKYLMYEDSIDNQVMDRLDERAMGIGWSLNASELTRKLQEQRIKNLTQKCPSK